MQYRSDLIFINPLDIRDKNGNVQLSFPNPVAGSDNYISVLNGNSSALDQYKGVGFSSNGGGTSIDMYFNPKGDGIARIYSSSATPYIDLIAGVDMAIATVAFVERAITIGVIYLRPVVAVFDNVGAALPTASPAVIDGHTVVDGDYILCRNSSDTYSKWIVQASISGSTITWSKVEDFIEESAAGEIMYRVGATTFVDNDSADPDITNQRLTYNGSEWVLQSNDISTTYTATEGVRLDVDTFKLAINELSSLSTVADTDYLVVYDVSEVDPTPKHKKITVSELISSYSYDLFVGADDSSTNTVADGDEIRILKSSTDNWVKTTYSDTGIHNIRIEYGLDKGIYRIIGTNDSGLPIEVTGQKGKIYRPAFAATWDSGTVGEFLHSTSLPLGIVGTAGKLALLSGEATQHYVELTTQSTTANQTYYLPSAYPSVNGKVLSSTTAGIMSWISLSENTDELVAASSGKTAGYLIDVLEGIGASPNSGIRVTETGTINKVFLQATVSDVSTLSLTGARNVALFDTAGDEIIAGKATVSAISSYFLLANYQNSTYNYYNGSIGVYELVSTDFILVGGEYVSSKAISTTFNIATYSSDYLLPIVQRKSSTTPNVWETITCDTRVSVDTVDIAFSNAPSAGEIFRVTLIFDPTRL